MGYPWRLGLHFTNDPAFDVNDAGERRILLQKVNMRFGKGYDAIAVKEIQEGEEILADYNYRGYN